MNCLLDGMKYLTVNREANEMMSKVGTIHEVESHLNAFGPHKDHSKQKRRNRKHRRHNRQAIVLPEQEDRLRVGDIVVNVMINI